MAIAVELQAKRRPGGNPQVDQSQFGIDAVKVVMQTLAAGWLHQVPMRCLVVPRAVTVAGLHGRDHVHQARVVAAPLEGAGDNVFLAGMALGDELDRYPCLDRQQCRPLPQAVPQPAGKCRVFEDRDASGMQVPGHPLGKANSRHRPGDYQPVVTRQNTSNAFVVALRQRSRHTPPPRTVTPEANLHHTSWFRLRRVRTVPKDPQPWLTPPPPPRFRFLPAVIAGYARSLRPLT
jgi:hypothetical protein